MPEKFNQSKNEQGEDFTQGLDYPSENEAGFDGLMSGENPDSNNDGERAIEENVLYFRKLNTSEKKILEGYIDGKIFKKMTEYLNRENFDVIFLTQSSSIPYGIILKEAYKTAFPNRKQPIFQL